jgi:alkylated DNA repair dioxygenase AlkB
MMKTLVAFMSGALMTTVIVVMASGYQAGMVILGGFLTLVALSVLVRMLGVTRVARWLLALQKANSETVYLERGIKTNVQRANVQNLSSSERHRRAPKRNRNVVTLPVLSTVQQDVLSALVNQGISFQRAEKIVIEVYRTGDSFEQLFRRSVAPARRTA